MTLEVTARARKIAWLRLKIIFWFCLFPFVFVNKIDTVLKVSLGGSLRKWMCLLVSRFRFGFLLFELFEFSICELLVFAPKIGLTSFVPCLLGRIVNLLGAVVGVGPFSFAS